MVLPPPTFVKGNCDASFNLMSSRFGIGCAFRDHYGLVIDGLAENISVATIEDAEAIAIHHTCLFAEGKRWTKIIFEINRGSTIM